MHSPIKCSEIKKKLINYESSVEKKISINKRTGVKVQIVFSVHNKRIKIKCSPNDNFPFTI